VEAWDLIAAEKHDRPCGGCGVASRPSFLDGTDQMRELAAGISRIDAQGETAPKMDERGLSLFNT
jgi:hypothetical protein